MSSKGFGQGGPRLVQLALEPIVGGQIKVWGDGAIAGFDLLVDRVDRGVDVTEVEFRFGQTPVGIKGAPTGFNGFMAFVERDVEMREPIFRPT